MITYQAYNRVSHKLFEKEGSYTRIEGYYLQEIHHGYLGGPFTTKEDLLKELHNYRDELYWGYDIVIIEHFDFKRD